MSYRATEPRCFPHAVPTNQIYRRRLEKAFGDDERYALEHIDRGFPLDSRHNDERELAYGGTLVSQDPRVRLGLNQR